MTRSLTLELPDSIYRSLAEKAQSEGRPMEEVALEKLADYEVDSNLEDPLDKFVGAFRSDVPDWADNHDRYLGENLYRELSGENE